MNELKRFKDIRQELGLTQAEFGALLGYTREQYANFEIARRDMPMDRLLRFKEIYLLLKEIAPEDAVIPTFNDKSAKTNVLKQLKRDYVRREAEMFRLTEKIAKWEKAVEAAKRRMARALALGDQKELVPPMFVDMIRLNQKDIMKRYPLLQLERMKVRRAGVESELKALQLAIATYE